MKKNVLHIGCGHTRLSGRALDVFPSDAWLEVRLDIDEKVNPDIVASMTDMAVVASGMASAIYSSHNLEHLYPHEVPVALAEFVRVLDGQGIILITVPNLRQVAQSIAEFDLDGTLYKSSAGPIAALDVIYGHRASMSAGNIYMAHRTGFSSKSLAMQLLCAGFKQVWVQPDGGWGLWAVAFKANPTEDQKNVFKTKIFARELTRGPQLLEVYVPG